MTAIEDIQSSTSVKTGHRPIRSTGAAISVAVGLLEGCLINTGSRIMLFTSGPSTIGPGMIVNSDLGNSIRTHRELSKILRVLQANISEIIKFVYRSRPICLLVGSGRGG
ncbi:Protein transport protein S23 G [Castilleja foliolosa]|uniref:Protein transport protein SEC23 n=1 Tax=Castilleja foliolosa TaxID=1961234 RepID=A0ABD3E7J2_9LAMI